MRINAFRASRKREHKLKYRQNLLSKLRGYTLTELLVAVVVSTIILSTLLFFTTSLVNSNRDEEAKATTQEEITAALNYIANDLQESVFIYGASALERNSTQEPPGIADQIPFGSTTPAPGVQARNNQRRPILAFWKRNYLDVEQDVITSSGTTRKVKCLPYPTGTSSCYGQSKFIYSLVVYYLWKDNSPTWSGTARLARWEIKDGIIWSCVDTSTAAQTDSTKCPVADKAVRDDRDPLTQDLTYVVKPSSGFRLFAISGAGTLAEKMNRWKKFPNENYNLSDDPMRVLVDFVDDTPYYPEFDDGVSVSLIKISARPNQSPTKPTPSTPINADCDSPDRGVGVPSAGTPSQTAFAERVPSTFSATGSELDVYRLSSFYACVANFGDPNQTVARVWLRGNPRARYLLNDSIRRQEIKSKIEGCKAKPSGPCTPVDSYFVTGDIRVLGRGQFKLE